MRLIPQTTHSHLVSGTGVPGPPPDSVCSSKNRVLPRPAGHSTRVPPRTPEAKSPHRPLPLPALPARRTGDVKSLGDPVRSQSSSAMPTLGDGPSCRKHSARPGGHQSPLLKDKTSSVSLSLQQTPGCVYMIVKAEGHSLHRPRRPVQGRAPRGKLLAAQTTCTEHRRSPRSCGRARCRGKTEPIASLVVNTDAGTFLGWTSEASGKHAPCRESREEGGDVVRATRTEALGATPPRLKRSTCQRVDTLRGPRAPSLSAPLTTAAHPRGPSPTARPPPGPRPPSGQVKVFL